MNICKKGDCVNETKGNNVYCSLSCRSSWTNRSRDYSSQRGTSSVRRAYDLSPKICLNCNKELEYKKRNNTYCSHSCAAKVTNIGLDRTKNVISAKGMESLIESNRKRISGVWDEYSKNPKYCLYCSKELEYKKRRYTHCSRTCRAETTKTDDPKRFYRRSCKFDFALKNYPDEFNFKLIEEYGWYSPTNKNNNLGGVSRDHMVSVSFGYENNIDPTVLSHPANCRLMIHSKNISRNNKNSITYDELLSRIMVWNIRYT